MMKDKENIEETGLYVYAIPFKQEGDLYRQKILILVPQDIWTPQYWTNMPNITNAQMIPFSIKN